MSRTSLKQVTHTVHHVMKKANIAFETRYHYSRTLIQGMHQLEKAGFYATAYPTTQTKTSAPFGDTLAGTRVITPHVEKPLVSVSIPVPIAG